MLVHPTNSKWVGTYSIPKGELQDFESPLETAIRETKEEIGIDFSNYFQNHNGIMDGMITYKNGKGKTYKKVFYFIVNLDKKIEIDKNVLQLEEVDWSGFVRKEEAEKRIFWRLKPILDKVFNE